MFPSSKKKKRKENKKFDFVICIFPVSESPVCIFSIVVSEVFFQNFKLKPPKREASSFQFELYFV